MNYKAAKSKFIEWHVKTYGAKKLPVRSTIEHIVPRSILKSFGKSLDVDMHNFAIYPSRLNSMRGSKIMTDRIVFDDSLTLMSPSSGNSESWMSASQLDSACFATSSAFVPGKEMRGRLARSVAYMMHKIPTMSRAIHEQVLDVNTLVLWHHEHPITRMESELDDFIHLVQGDRNPIVKDPEFIWDAICEFRDLAKCGRRMFGRFDYGTHSFPKNTT